MEFIQLGFHSFQILTHLISPSLNLILDTNVSLIIDTSILNQIKSIECCTSGLFFVSREFMSEDVGLGVEIIPGLDLGLHSLWTRLN